VTWRIILAAAFLVAAVGLAAAQHNMPTIAGAVAAIAAVGTGTTGAVTATLAGVVGRVNYLCGFDISATGGSATISPISVTGLLGGTFTYQGISAGGAPFQHAFNPCVPASAANTAIAVSTTANGTATAVNVNAWGFQQ
jgi:hypothetical protein